VIQDRYLDSSVAYQGAGRVLDPTEVRDISLWATEGFMPNLTILLDLDEKIGRERLDEARTKYDRLEAEESDFHSRVRASFLELASAEPDRFLVLPATDSIEHLAAAIRARVQPLLGV
jgi:dTMP kinase